MKFDSKFAVAAMVAVTFAMPFAASAQIRVKPAEAGEAVPSLNAPERLGSIAARKCDKRTPSGLGYSVLESGAGDTPTKADNARVGYAGYFLTTGGKFDASDDARFPVRGVVPGFSEGLQLMQRGAKYRLCIPSKLGYGARGAGSVIPPHSNLIFLVQLHDF